MVRMNKEGINGCCLLVSDTMDCLKIFIKVIMSDEILRKVSNINTFRKFSEINICPFTVRDYYELFSYTF